MGRKIVFIIFLLVSQSFVSYGAVNFVSSDKIDCGTSNPSSDDLTISLWVKWDGTDSRDCTMLAKRDSWGASTMMWQLARGASEDSIAFNTPNNTTARFKADLTSGSWVHVCVVHDAGATDKLYLNGVYQCSNTAVTFGTGTSAHIYIGDDNSSNSFAGQISEVAIFNAALTATQVALLTGGVKRLPAQFSSCVRYWPLDDVGIDASADGATFRELVNEYDAEGDNVNGSGLTGAGEVLTYP